MSFEGTGTFNGTGNVQRRRVPSPVQWWSPARSTGPVCLPGTYNMIAQLANGKERPPAGPGRDWNLTRNATMLQHDHAGCHLQGHVCRTCTVRRIPNQTIEFVDAEPWRGVRYVMTADRRGTETSPTAPIPAGDYYYRGDVDDDGWYDYNETAFVTDDMTNITLALNVPETADVRR